MGSDVMIHTHHRALLLIALGSAGVEVAIHPTNEKFILHRPSTLPNALFESVLDHRDAILDLLNDGYSPTEPEAVYIYFERLGIGDDLGMPTHSGSPAWLIAVGESMKYSYLQTTNTIGCKSCQDL